MSKQLIYLSNIIILCSTPFITPYIIPHYSIIVALLLCLLIVGFYKMHFRFDDDLWGKTIKYCIFCAFAHGFLTCIIFIDEQGMLGLRNAIGMSMRYLFVLVSIPLIKYHYKKYHSLLWIINIVIILLAILLFFLCFIGIYPPYIMFDPDGREHYFFYIGATNQFYEFGQHAFIRTAGYCDEPGRLALVLTYLLVLNEFTYKKNYLRVLLCVAGFLTFSAALFITMLPIGIFWIKQKIVNVRTILIGLFIGIFASVIFLKNVDTEVQENINDAFDILVTNRFEKGSDGKYHGDNRSEAIGLHFEAFFRSPIVGIMGKGPECQTLYRLGTPTFSSGLGRYGLFDLLFYLPFIVLFKKYRRTSYKWLFIAIGINFLQRPDIEHMFFLVILSLIYYHQNFNSAQEPHSNNKEIGSKQLQLSSGIAVK